MKATKQKPRLLGLSVAAGIPIALLGVFYLLSGNTALMDTLCARFSTPVLNAMGRFFSRIPISFLELFIALAVIAGVVFLLFLIRSLLRGKGRRLPILAKYLLILTIILSWIWNGYCWLWNSGYFGYSFAHHAGLQTQGMTVPELTDAAAFFLEQTNPLSQAVPRDDSGAFIHSFEDYAGGYADLYAPLEQEFPCLAGSTTPPKGVICSRFMSQTGFTGVFFPFTGETYVNTHHPDWCIGLTVAHEIAHQRGVHIEAEANFLGIAACIQSEDPAYRYSGYASGLLYLMNALYNADREAWESLRSRFTPELNTDWAENNQYWAQMESQITKTTTAVYDTFLKVNTQTDGMKSYGKCVDLLVLWLNTSANSPRIQTQS